MPIHTYFIQGSIPIPGVAQSRIEKNDGEVCESVYFLGKRGLLKTTQALRVAFLSGAMDSTVDAGDATSADAPAGLYYTNDDVKALKETPLAQNMTAGVDILLTYEWPQDVHSMSSQSLAPKVESMSLPVAEAAATLAPRYHFAAAEGTFFEREPYRNVPGFVAPGVRHAEHVTRFIGLADVANSNRARVSRSQRAPTIIDSFIDPKLTGFTLSKWYYAFNIVPMTEAPMDVLLAEPPNTTDFPLMAIADPSVVSGMKRPLDDGNGGFFWGDEGRDAKKRGNIESIGRSHGSLLC